ncbi:MAG: cupin domain-containing protein [Allorhizobium sp.]
MTGTFVRNFPAIDAGGGVTRKVVADSPELMVVEFRFSEGGVGALHSHPHVQSTYVKSGRFEFTIGDRTFEIGPGDSFVIPSMATHGCRALEAGTLVDTFTPRRDDFL